MGNDQPKKRPQPKQDPSDKMFDTMFEFKMMGKQMAKEAKKAETQNKNLIKKVKDCIARGDYEQAKVAASDAIRQKNQVRRYRVLSSKIDTVAQRLQSAYQNQRLTEQMQSLTQQMVGAGNMMDMVKMTETMANFEKLFDDLDVNSAMMDQVFDNASTRRLPWIRSSRPYQPDVPRYVPETLLNAAWLTMAPASAGFVAGIKRPGKLEVESAR